MSKKGADLEAAYELRDLIADAIIDYEREHGSRVVLDQQYALDNPARARLGQLAVEIVAPDGNTKATTYRSLKE